MTFNGNRTMEETGVDLASKNEYGYDAQGHLTTTTKDGKLDNERVYDQMGRAVFVKKLSYKDGNTNTTYDFKNTYDANGRLSYQVLQDAADGKITNVSNVYDKVGNLVESWRNKQDNPNIQYLYAYQLFGDALKQNTVTAFRSDNGGNPGVTESKYDFSGNLVKLHDRQKSENDREFINDAGGFVLLKSQNLSKATPDQLHNLVANGQVLGSYGSDLDAENPDTSSNYASKTGDTLQSIAASKTGESWKELFKPELMVWVNEDIDPDEEKVNMQDVAYRIDNTVKVTVAERQNMRLVEGQNIIIHAQNMSDKMRNFIDYQKIDQAHPGADTMAYRVMVGDSLRGIAQKIYGDADLWYVLADANGLFSDSDLRAGQVLNVPARVSGVHNNATTFKPYEPGAIIGDTSPYIPPPESGGNRCAVIGIIIAAVVAAVVITVLTAGAGAAIAGPGLSVAATVAVGVASGAVGGALGSAASQGILIAGGLQSSFSWKDVGIGALTGAITGGAMAWAGAAGNGAATGAKAGATAAEVAATTAANAARAASLSARIGAIALRSAGYAALNVVNDAITQGINMSANHDVKFSWQSMVAAGASGALSGAASGILSKTSSAWSQVAMSTLGDVAGSAISNTIKNDGGFDATQFAIDVTGNVVGGLAGGLSNHLVEKWHARNTPAAKEDIEMDVLGMPAVDEAKSSQYDKDIILRIGGSDEVITAANNLSNKNKGEVLDWTPGKPLPLNATDETRIYVVGHDEDFNKVGGGKALADFMRQDFGLNTQVKKVRLVGCNQEATAQEFAAASAGIARKVAARADREWVSEDGRKHVVTDEGYSLAKGAQKVFFEDGARQANDTKMSAAQLRQRGVMPLAEDERMYSLGKFGEDSSSSSSSSSSEEPPTPLNQFGMGALEGAQSTLNTFGNILRPSNWRSAGRQMGQVGDVALNYRRTTTSASNALELAAPLIDYRLSVANIAGDWSGSGAVIVGTSMIASFALRRPYLATRFATNLNQRLGEIPVFQNNGWPRARNFVLTRPLAVGTGAAIGTISFPRLVSRTKQFGSRNTP